MSSYIYICQVGYIFEFIVDSAELSKMWIMYSKYTLIFSHSLEKYVIFL